jgi:flagellar L-ring protein precursor FlgH
MMVKFVVLILSLTMITGCSSFGKKWKAFLNEGEEKPVVTTKQQSGDVKYSDVRDVPVNSERQYRRMTKKQFEDQELFSDNAGSLWVNEGQDSYLFAQNIIRLPGDILNVVLDGQPEKQLSTKAQVIKELTSRIEKRSRGVASTDGKPADAKADAAKAAGDKKSETTAAAEKPTDEGALPNAGNFDVKTIPTRIVERMSDGNYRVKGSQTFMIGSKEYKVIATGMVKPQDIADDNVVSSKMLDSKFDIVRGKGKTL